MCLKFESCGFQFFIFLGPTILSDWGSRFPTGKPGNDRGNDMSGGKDLGSAKKSRCC